MLSACFPGSLLRLPMFASALLVAVGPCLSAQPSPDRRHRAGQGGAGYDRISVRLLLLFGVLSLALYLAMAAEEVKGGRRAVACARGTFNSCLHSSLPRALAALGLADRKCWWGAQNLLVFGCLKDEDGFCVPFPLALEKMLQPLCLGRREKGELWKGNKLQRNVSPAERAIVFLHLHCRASSCSGSRCLTAKIIHLY